MPNQIDQLFEPTRPLPGCRLIDFKLWPGANSTLFGHCVVAFSGDWTVTQIPIFRGRDGLSVGVPSIPQLDAEGRIRVGPTVSSSIYRSSLLAAAKAGNAGISRCLTP